MTDHTFPDSVEARMRKAFERFVHSPAYTHMTLDLATHDAIDLIDQDNDGRMDPNMDDHAGDRPGVTVIRCHPEGDENFGQLRWATSEWECYDRSEDEIHDYIAAKYAATHG